ncbi:MAG: YitT family protein [Kouleothrix sp.]|nr:YitT family protein [Kouleothrix sp.]
MRQQTIKRWSYLILGLICFGAGVALMVRANLGLSPWEILHQGISEQTGIPIGTVSILLGVPILLAWLPLGQRPGWGTLVNIILIGLVTNLVLAALPPPAGLAPRALLMVGGILVIGVGSGLYLTAEMGAGPRDGLMLGLARRSGWSVRLIRTLLEVAVLACGWLLGGTIGVGTLAFAFGIGPVVQAALRIFQRSNARTLARSSARPSST